MNIITYICIAIITVIYVVSAKKLAKQSYQKGMKAGTNKAIEWLTIALAASGFKGKQLTDLLTTMAGHLQNLKAEIDQSDEKQEGGVTQGQ